jgi:hypothetical protein
MLFRPEKNYDRLQRTFVRLRAGQGSPLRAVQPKMLAAVLGHYGRFLRMPKMDMTAVILRATDLLWCLAISDVEDYFEDRRPMLHELKLLEERSRQLRHPDFYAAVVEAQEKRPRVQDPAPICGASIHRSCFRLPAGFKGRVTEPMLRELLSKAIRRSDVISGPCGTSSVHSIPWPRTLSRS